jgi:hypothetical protein
VGDGLGEGDEVGDALAEGTVTDGDGDGDVSALQVMPLKLKTVGLASVPLKLKLAPTSTEPPWARLPFQVALVTVTLAPICVHLPSHPFVRV